MVATNLSYANMPFYNYLPMMYTNFGGDTQICTIEPYSAYNFGYSLNPVAQQTWGTLGTGSIFGCLPSGAIGGSSMQEAIVRGAQQLLAPALNNMTSANLNRCIGNISQMKTRLESQLQNPDITDEQKQQIEAKLEEIKAKEDELQKIAKSTDLDPQTAYQKVAALEKEVRTLMTDTVKMLNEMNKSSSTDETTSTDESSSTTTSTTSTTNPTSTTTTSTSESSSTDESSDAQGKVDDFDDTTYAAVDQLFTAIDGWGTNNEKMEEVLKLITKDNVMELMLAWNQTKSKIHGESLMKAFMWDADHGQKKTYGAQIKTALFLKAKELGILDECTDDFAKIDKELGSWSISNDISENYDNIIKKIAAKMGSKYGTPYEKAGSESKK